MTSMIDSNTLLEEARELDRTDSLSEFRSQFHIPHVNDVEDLYLVGNSLGLVPRRTADYVQEELSRWANLGVRGHFTGSPNWASYHECLAGPMAELVGATESEVITMNTLTVNLHLMMATFYRPSKGRAKILIESHAFPSDKNAVESQIQLHGFLLSFRSLRRISGESKFTGIPFTKKHFSIEFSFDFLGVGGSKTTLS